MESDQVNIRPATSDDVASMIALERACPSAAHWSEKQYQNLFSTESGKVESLILVVDETTSAEPGRNPHFWRNRPELGHPRLLGFLVARHVAREWELENIVVAPSARRKGLGRRLLQALLDRAAQANGEVFLEVRESNTAARRLYEMAGFREAGRRKSYYVNPSEDAVVYRHRIDQVISF